MNPTIDVERRAFDWFAWVGDRAQCSRGSSIDEAVASLLESWPDEFEPASGTVLIRLHLSTRRESP